MAVGVLDDVHRPTGPGAALWRGDAVEVVLRLLSPAEVGGGEVPWLPDEGRTVHLAAALRDGVTLLRCVGRSGVPPGVECAARRWNALDGGGPGRTNYEWFVPWSVLGGVGAVRGVRRGGVALPRGVLVGVLVSDDDGAGPEAGVEFGRGISGGVVPGLLGLLRVEGLGRSVDLGGGG